MVLCGCASSYLKFSLFCLDLNLILGLYHYHHLFMNTVIRKRKLTTEQKNNIVKLAKTNPKMKQDEIARQFGVDRSTISKVLTESKKPKRVPSETGEAGDVPDEIKVEDEPVEQLTQDNYSRGTRSRSSSGSHSYSHPIEIFGSSPLEIASTPYHSHYSPYSSYSSSLESFQSINDHFDSLSFTNYISYEDNNITIGKALDALGIVKKYLEQQLAVNDGNRNRNGHPNAHSHAHSNSHSHSFIPNSEDITQIDSLAYRIQSSIDEHLGLY